MASIRAPIGEIAGALYGSLRLAFGDKNGTNYFNTSHLGFWRSFTAAIIVAPIFILLLNVRYIVSDSDINFFRFVSIYATAYVIGWIVFPLVINYITGVLGNGDKFVGYIVIYNWASVLQNFIYLPFAILVEAHLIYGTAATIIGIFLLGLVFLYTSFITKTALEVSNGIAAAIVILDLILSIIISAVTQRILHVI
jgi:hypothetical protein